MIAEKRTDTGDAIIGQKQPQDSRKDEKQDGIRKLRWHKQHLQQYSQGDATTKTQVADNKLARLKH